MSHLSPDCVQLKLVFIGSVNVGKTCLSRRLQGHQGPLPLTRPTAFSETVSIHYENDDGDPDFPRCVVHLFDTAGQERFHSVARTTYRGAKIIFIVFSVDDFDSFNALEGWYDRVKSDVDPDAVFIMVGNKCDVPNDQRAVTTAEGDAKSRAMNMPYFETSAQDTTNVKETFEYAVREAVKKVKLTMPAQRLAQPKIVRPVASLEDDQKKGSDCC